MMFERMGRSSIMSKGGGDRAQLPKVLAFGAGLPANIRPRQCPLTATIRQQAGSYKGKDLAFFLLGACLQANLCLR